LVFLCYIFQESTSFLSGIEVCAPFFVTTIVDTLMAKDMASRWFLPSERPNANAAVKESPAAVVSTTLTVGAGK